MIVQYPDSIKITIPRTYFQNTSTGDYSSTSDSETDITFDCRAEGGPPADKGNIDGVETDYQWTIYAGPMSVEIPEGCEYVLTRRGFTYTGRIAGCILNQLNTKLWG
jgi:hypothetical protein